MKSLGRGRAPVAPASSKVGAGRSIVNRNERSFKRGSLMFIEGESSTEMFILRNGKVRILKQQGENSIELATLGAGSVLGELSLLDHQPRGATAQVLEDVTVTVVDEAMLNATLQRVPPWLANIIHVVVKRLRDTHARTARDIVEKAVGGSLRVLIVLYETQGIEVDGEKRLDLQSAKSKIHGVVGIGDVEAENVFLHLILKNMMFIRKDDTGTEFLVFKDLEILKLYLNYLRTKQRGAKMVGEDFAPETHEVVPYIIAAGAKNGRKIKDKVYKIGVQQVGIEMGRDGKSADVSLDAIDELVAAKAIVMEESSAKTDHGTHKRSLIMYNEDTLKRITLLGEWVSTFKEDVLL